MEDPFYMPEHFSEEMLEPFEWGQILATLDVCANEATPTKFCDKMGNAVFPIMMMNALKDEVSEVIIQVTSRPKRRIKLKLVLS